MDSIRITGIANQRSPFIAALLSVAALMCEPARSVDAARSLTFENRVAAQAAIERVYYSHQLGATKPFEEAVPHEVLEKKVRTYLKQSIALESVWDTPLTVEMLQQELARMAHDSRMPDRLAELYAALDDDPVLILECLARPILVNRLTREFYGVDDRIHGPARLKAEQLRRRLVAGEIDPSTEDPRRTLVEYLRDPQAGSSTAASRGSELDARRPSDKILESLSPEQFDRWSRDLAGAAGEIGSVKEERDGFKVGILLEREPERVRLVRFTIEKKPWDEWWTNVQGDYAETEAATVVGRVEQFRSRDEFRPASRVTGSGAPLSLCGPDDAWTPTSTTNAPPGLSQHTAVWTGSQMIVWAGNGNGSRYDPATGTWTPVSFLGSGYSRSSSHTAVWTGSLMIVWGGELFPAGAGYEPISDTWTAISLTNAPLGRYYHTAVWTGSQMVVWGGLKEGGQPVSTGGRYDPVTNTWTQISTTNAPSPSTGHTAIWSGSLMVVWGGNYGLPGGRYNPVTDTWTPISTTNEPYSGVDKHTAVWTGNRMIVWGGEVFGCCGALNLGGLYDPTTDTWTQTSLVNAPTSRFDHSAVWAGGRMVVWGGEDSGNYFNTGGLYDPATNTWTPTSTVDAPLARTNHTAVWTGSRMIVWGGWGGGSEFLTGAQYNVGLHRDDDGDTFSDCDGDCNDGNAAIHPGAAEICDGLDNDCDGAVDEGFQVDVDGDGVTTCSGDCDDGNASVFPGAPQVCDGVNNNCALPGWPSLAGTNEADDDNDSLTECQGDCDDTNAAVHPGAPEVCDLADNDCDGDVNEGMDGDGDGWSGCGSDCDDTNSSVYPGAPQLCDGLNNDCISLFWPQLDYRESDYDGDGVMQCQGDCIDTNANVWMAPSEPTDLVLSYDVTTGETSLDWSPSAQPGATYVAYDVLRTGNKNNFASPTVCLETNDGSNTSALDTAVPIAGTGFFFLIRAENDCPAGSRAGSDSNGAPIQARSCP